MSHDTIWGAALIAYVIPWAIWAARKPNLGDSEAPEARRATQIGLGLSAGFVVLLALRAVSR